MSPRSSTLLALIGVLLAGIPLPAITAARRDIAAAPQKEAAPRQLTYATLQCSGQPTELSLWHEGHELARLGEAELATTPVELELMLPPAAELELEVQARWPQEGSPQAVTLTLEPEGQSQRQNTQWTEPDGAELHSIMRFSW